MVKKRIACFLTGGYSEAGYMQSYLEKINPNYEYKQFMPNKTIKKKGYSKSIKKDFNGLTGDSLIDKIEKLLCNPKIKKDVEDTIAIIIEDDTDNRFVRLSDEEIAEYLENQRKKIRVRLTREIPIIFILASPEIESWFIADWDNGFGNLIENSNFIPAAKRETKRFYSRVLRKEIAKICGGITKIEFFAENQDKYVKMSEAIQELVSIKVINVICSDNRTNADIKNELKNASGIYYNKRQHGSVMLKQIDPKRVVVKCNKYFKMGYYELKELE